MVADDSEAWSGKRAMLEWKLANHRFLREGGRGLGFWTGVGANLLEKKCVAIPKKSKRHERGGDRLERANEIWRIPHVRIFLTRARQGNMPVGRSRIAESFPRT